MQRHLLTPCAVNLFTHNSGDTLKLRGGFHVNPFACVECHFSSMILCMCVCTNTCIYGKVATWKINAFIFCQLALHFCLLCPDSQLGGTLISSCETQSGSAWELSGKLRISERGPCQEQRSVKNWCFKWTGFELWCSAFALCLWIPVVQLRCSPAALVRVHWELLHRC